MRWIVPPTKPNDLIHGVNSARTNCTRVQRLDRKTSVPAEYGFNRNVWWTLFHEQADIRKSGLQS